ncbi:copper chaperone PCu(A)C [Yoonia sp. SS1-5]|uniref:Copper chaperone PCu(A)C n=1 Tax=Yoonia rhodophyticola TaxID=3137370 RepID=A0AAN0MCA0_9RHOB
MRLFGSLVAAATMAASTLSAHEFKLGDLVVDHPYSFETTKTAMAGAGYLTITNTGTEADRLIGVEAAFDRVMIHKTEVNAEGVATMPHQDGGIEIAAGETVTLAPGGLHVMFMGLGGDPFEEGESFDATLTFEKAGTLEIIFNVETRDAATEEVDHSQHGSDS